MAKASSPLRLQEELVKKATLASKPLHRSTAEQIEYWADIGERVSRSLSPAMLMQLSSGLAQIQVRAVRGKPVDPESIFAAVERARESGDLARQVTGSPVRYQASESHPGLLERIDENGLVEVGQFRNGEFVPMEQGTLA